MQTTVSVVIPARDSQATIRPTITALVAQTRPADEILLVIGPKDETTSAIADFVASGVVRVVHAAVPEMYVRDTQFKRLVGAHQASGDVLFFLDSKVVLESDALEVTMALMHEYRAEALSGVTPAWSEQQSSFLVRVQDAGLVTAVPSYDSIGWLDADSFRNQESLPVTATFAMSRQAFRAIERDFALEFSLRAYSYEDYVLSWLLVREGYKILVTNRVVGRHLHRTSLSGILRQVARSGHGAAVLRVLYPDCPLGNRRLWQVGAVVGSLLVYGVLVIVALGSLSHWLLATLGAALILGFGAAGLVNALRTRDIAALAFPPITALLIVVFSIHFLRGCFVGVTDATTPSERDAYLQIH